ncbi:MAG: hypothetical protein ISQ34_02015 [Rickettsiales bacterium]|nr:hypothetical protein [Rickettsiales bacterium]
MEKKQLKINPEVLEELSHEARKMLDILDQIETHTADLRKKLVAELKPKDSSIKLKLDEIK